MEIIRIDPFGEAWAVKVIAAIYQQSFGGEPWNEGYLCPECESVFGSTPSISTCPKCRDQSKSVLVVEYWPVNKIVLDFYREMRKPNPICIAARSDDELVGFAWGYQVSANTDLDVLLDAPGLHQLLHGDFFYLDECALVPSHQGRGIGRLLVERIFREQQQGRVLLRTKNDSRMCTLIGHMGGKIIQHLSGNRIIMQL